MSPNFFPLSELARGIRAVILNVEEATSQRDLAARGLTPGAEVSIVATGDPLLISVDQAQWAIGRASAAAIWVAPV